MPTSLRRTQRARFQDLDFPISEPDHAHLCQVPQRIAASVAREVGDHGELSLRYRQRRRIEWRADAEGAEIERESMEYDDRADAKKVEHLLYISEYKRFQSAPGARLSQKAFWLDRRYPIANRWRDNG